MYYIYQSLLQHIQFTTNDKLIFCILLQIQYLCNDIKRMFRVKKNVIKSKFEIIFVFRNLKQNNHYENIHHIKLVKKTIKYSDKTHLYLFIICSVKKNY